MKTGKKILSFILTVLMCFNLITLSVIAADEESLETTGQCGDNVYWTFDEGMGELVISGSGNMYDYSYDTSPFYKNNNIKNVIINYGPTSIGKYLFFWCENICNVKIPDSVISIGYDSFAGCENLREIKIPDSVIEIGSGALRATGLESIIIPDGVTKINSNLFSDCKNLSEVTLPDGILSIGQYAFLSSGIESINIGDSTEAIDQYAFAYAEKLRKINIGCGLKSLGDYVFKDCTSLEEINVDENNMYFSSMNGVLFDKNQTTLRVYPMGSARTAYTIPDTVKNINYYAFLKAMNLKSVTIPDNVEIIAELAFAHCSDLSDINIGKGVKGIGSSAFYNTSYYNNIENWENGVLYIGNYLIEADSSISECTVKEGTLSIANCAFQDCENIETLVLPSTLNSIGTASLSYWSDGYYSKTFLGCKNLKSVYTPDIESWCQISFYDPISNPTYYGADLYIGGKTITDLKIPESVTEISQYAFYGFENITNIELHDKIRKIGKDAFTGTSYYNNSEKWENGVLYLDNHLIKINSDFDASVYEIKYGTKVIADNAFYGSSVTKIDIPDSVVTIGDSAFMSCMYISDINIPDSVTYIGEAAFCFCLSLTDITIPDSISEICRETFMYCMALKNVTIPKNVSSIETLAFDGCSSVTDVYYLGNETEWNSIDIDLYNEYLTGANIHFATFEEPEADPDVSATEPDEPSVEPEEPSEPEDPSKDCSCYCHKKGILNFFFKIIIFFERIFGANRVCDCGIAHY